VTYFIHRSGVIKKTWLRILNACLIIMIPIGAYKNKKYFEIYSNTKQSYWKSFIEEIQIWKEGFNLGN
jgi:hypothetical protein